MKAIESLNNHVSGAEALLQLRGKQQVETVLGRELFSQIRAQVVSPYVSTLKFGLQLIFSWQITRCWQTHTAVPGNIMQWSDAAIQYENVEEAAATRLSKIRSRKLPAPFSASWSKIRLLSLLNLLAIFVPVCLSAWGPALRIAKGRKKGCIQRPSPATFSSGRCILQLVQRVALRCASGLLPT